MTYTADITQDGPLFTITYRQGGEVVSVERAATIERAQVYAARTVAYMQQHGSAALEVQA